MGKLAKKVEKRIQYQAVKFIAQVFYLAGLTLLLPMFPILLAPELFKEVRLIFFAAIILIVSSFLIIIWFTHSKKRAFKILGMITLIPGLAAIIFAAFGTDWLLYYAKEFSPFVQHWISHYVPKSWFIAGTHIILGTILVWFGEQFRR